MPDYSNIASCSIGGSSFQLSDWGLSSEPVRNEDGLVMGRRLVITGEGWVEGTNAADFAAKVLAATAAFSVQGVNVIIKGLGGNVEAELLAARCVDFGPVVSVTVLPQGGGTALRKTFQFVAEGETAPAADEGSTGSVRRTQRKSITERPDGLLRVRMTGELIGPDAGLNYDTLLAETRADYPWPRWTVSEDTHEQNASGDKVSYAVVAEQLSDDLVEVADTRAVDGSYSESVEQDEHNRIMRVYTWDLLVEGNPWALEPVLRPTGVIVRSRFDTSRIKERRVRASWSVLDSQDAKGLLEWVQSFETPREAAQGRVEVFEGVKAIVIYNRAPVHRVVQQGRAVGLMRYPAAPAAETIAGYVLAQDPVVRHARINDYELETSWTYVFVGVRALGAIDVTNLVAGSRRPLAPVFI